MTIAAGRAPALEVRGAARRLGGRAVLDGVSCAVASGTAVVLAGANGAGKSSLLRAIAGRLALDAGAIRIDGRDAAAARRGGRLGVVPQDLALDPHLSVRENLRLWAALAGVRRGEVDDRIDRALERADLTDRASARVETLSGGMRRRIHLLAGVLHAPSLLLLDEPTVGLDRESRGRVYALLDDLRREGTGVLLVSHDLDEAAARCDRLVVMHGGRVVADDTAAALVAQYCHTGGDIVVVPDDGVDAAPLVARGFAVAPDGAWHRADDARPTDLRTLDAELRAAGAPVREIRWQRPSPSSAVAAIIATASGGVA